MAARAGTAFVDFRGDFSKLRREFAVEMQKYRKEHIDIKGDVDINTRGFAKVTKARKLAEAQVAKPIEQRFVGEVERGGWLEFEALNDQAEREAHARKIETVFGFKVDKKTLLTGLQQVKQARAQAEREAGIDEAVRLRLSVDADDAEIAAVRKEVEAKIERTGPVKKPVKFDLDETSHQIVKRAIDDIDFKARGIRHIQTKFDVDTRTATAAFASLNRESGGTNRNLNQTTRAAVGATGAFGLLAKSTTGLVGGMFQFKTRIPLVQLAVFGKILYTAAGGAISLAGALAPLTGLLGAIGPLASSAFQGIKTIGLATAGIGDAVKAAFSEQDKSAAGATSSMAAATGAAEAVRAATVSLGDAERTQRFAVEDLTRAREEGTRQIEDMRAAVRGLALEEEGATLGLKEAKQALNQLVAEGADQLEVDRALLSVREARSELQKTRQEGKRARSDLGAIGAAGGVKGLPQVVQARRSLADANRGVAEAERELAKAVKQSSEAMGGGGAAADALKQKMAGLAPAAQDFAKFLIGLRPKLKQLQATAAAGLLPGVQKGIKLAMENFPRLNKVIKGTSEVLGDLAEQVGKRLGSEEWGKDLEVQGKRNEVTISRLGTAGLNLAEAFKDVTLAAGPMVNMLTHWVEALTEHWKELANDNRENGKLQKFFKDAGDTFRTTVKILRDLTVSFKNIGKAGRDAFGNELLSAIRKGAANLREWTGSLQGQREMRSVFRDIGNDIKAVGRFVQALSEDFRQLKKEGNTTGEAIAHIMTDLLAEMIVAGAKGAGQFLKAFGEGFLKAGPFEKLILAAIALPKIAAVGRAVGFVLGTGVSQGAAAGIAGTGAGAAAGGGLLASLRNKLIPLAGKIGLVGVGALLAKNVLNEFSRTAAMEGPDAFKALKAAQGPDPLGLFGAADKTVGSIARKFGVKNPIFSESEEAAQRLLPKLKAIAEQSEMIDADKARALREEIGKLSGVSDVAKEGLRQIVDRAAEIADTSARLSVKFDVNTPIAAIRRISNAFDDLRSHTTASLSTTARIAERNMRLIARSLGKNSKQGRDALRENFRLAANDIRSLVDSGLTTASKGSAAIRKLFIKYLGTFGLKGSTAKFYLEQGARGTGFVPGSKGQPAGGHKLQKGGMVVPGSGSGDKVPLTAMVEPGERVFVLNRNASKKLDYLHDLNEKVPRFQRGGEVGAPHLQAGGGLQAGIAGLLKRVLKEFPGLSLTSGRRNRGDGSFHDSGQAVDVASGNYPYMHQAAEWVEKRYGRSLAEGIHNPNLSIDEGRKVPSSFWGGDTWAGHANHIHLAITGALEALGFKVPKLPKFEIKGPVSAVAAGAQSGLNKLRDVAQRALQNAADQQGATTPDDSFTGNLGAFSKGRLRSLWTRAGGDPGVSNLMAAIALAESGGRADAHGPPDGRGLWQIEWPIWSSTLGGIGNPYNPSANAQMAVEILKRQGLGAWVVYNTGAYQQFLQRGGLADPGFGQAGAHLGVDKKKLGGSLPKVLKQTLKKVTKGATKKKRSKALDAFKRKIGKLRLPPKLQTAILGQLEQHEQFSDLASRAGGLSTTDPNTDVAQLAKVGNKNEGGWLVEDLSVLTKLRNNLLKVRTIILKKQGILERALKVAQDRLKKLSKKGTTPRKWKGLNPAKDSIAKWNKQPAEKRQKRVKEWHKLRGSLPGDREFTKDGKLLVGPGRRKSALTNIVASLKTQRNNLLNDPDVGLGSYGSSGTGMLATLYAVQGYPASGDLFKHHPTLPPLGEFGGYIGTAQDALAALGESLRARSDSSASSDVSDSGRGDRLEELLRLERQRGLVRDIEVAELLRSARMPPFGGSFAQGGPVPGPVGAARTIIAHGGETVVPRDGQGGITYLIIQDGAVDPNKIRVIASDEAKVVVRREARSVGRVPGLAGSLKP